jgi:hypothetical protein
MTSGQESDGDFSGERGGSSVNIIELARLFLLRKEGAVMGIAF